MSLWPIFWQKSFHGGWVYCSLKLGTRQFIIARRRGEQRSHMMGGEDCEREQRKRTVQDRGPRKMKQTCYERTEHLTMEAFAHPFHWCSCHNSKAIDRCQTADEWIIKTWFICRVECDLATEKNKMCMKSDGTWEIILSEVSNWDSERQMLFAVFLMKIEGFNC